MVLHYSKNKGFTLVELLVVISIMVILATIGISIYSSSQKNARDVRRKSEIEQIARAIEITYSSTGIYGAVAGSAFGNGTFPQDPMNNSTYFYSSSIDGDAPTTSAISSIDAGASLFVICARLETSSEGNSSDRIGTTTGTLDFYCKKSQQG